MFHVRTVNAIFNKQIKDFLKNTHVLVLFLIYPLIAYIMTSTISAEIGQSTFFISVFGTMHCVFAPIVATAAIIAEEKEKNTLRVLIMSNVSSIEYLISIGGFILICTLITGTPFVIMGEYKMTDAFLVIGSMCMGTIISIILGMTIGAYTKNMMSANAIAVPFSMLLAFTPMLASFNKSIEKVSQFSYGQQINYLITEPGNLSFKGFIILFVNLILFAILFMLIFKKNKLDT